MPLSISKIVILTLLVFLGAASVAQSSREAASPNWGREWTLFSNSQGDYETRKLTPLFGRRRAQSQPSFWGRPTMRSSWFNQVTGQDSGPSDAECNQSSYSAKNNTPSRVPDRIPFESLNADPVDSESWFGSYRNPQAGAFARAFSEAAKREAAECRETASHVRRRTGASQICGMNRSKGKCYAAVKDALVSAGLASTRLPGASAIQAHTQGHLSRLGFVNMIRSVNAQSAAEGCVFVYSGGNGHSHGHIEVKTDSGFCSDYCSARPLTSRHHRLEAVYCKM